MNPTQPAGICRRFGAYWIDNALYAVLLVIVIVPVSSFMLAAQLSPEGTHMAQAAIMLASSGAYVGFRAGFHSGKRQATPGKRLLGIYLCGSMGERIGLLRAILRELALLAVPCLTILTYAQNEDYALPGQLLSGATLLVFAAAIFTGQRTTLYDFLLSTRVRQGKI